MRYNLLIFPAIVFLLGSCQYPKGQAIHKELAAYSTELTALANNQAAPLKKVKYEGISFQYPAGWNIEKTEIRKHIAYQIVAQKDYHDSAGLFSVTWLKGDASLHEFITNTLDAIKKQFKNNSSAYIKDGIKLHIKDGIDSTFRGVKSRVVHYRGNAWEGKTIYTRMIAFKAKGNTVLIQKQGFSKADLDSTVYRIMEESLCMNQ